MIPHAVRSNTTVPLNNRLLPGRLMRQYWGSPYATGPLSCLSSLSVCNVGVLWPNGWMDQDAIWYGGRPRFRRHCVRSESSSPTERDRTVNSPPPLFGPCLLWPNGWMDQDTTWYGGRPRPTCHYVRWGPSSPPWKGAQQPQPHFSARVYCGQTVAHLSIC